jgi:hypothetical protein
MVRIVSEDEMIRLLKKISEDIAVIKRYARVQASSGISSMLKVVAKTPERQEMWRLADGTHSNEEIANRIGVTLRSVQYFVQEAEDAELIIMERRGYPKRIANLIPPEWKPWKPKVARIAELETEPQKSQATEGEADVKE